MKNKNNKKDDEIKHLKKRIREFEKSEIKRKQAEEKLLFEQKQLFPIFDSVDEVIYVVDPDTYELLYFNKAFKSHWKGKRGDKCYKVLQDRTSPCPFCSNKNIFGKNLGKTYIWEFQNLVNKHWYRCIDKAIKWPNERMVRYEMAIDIPENKNYEEALKQSEKKYRTLVESLEEGITAVDENENFTFVNQATCNISGYTKEEFLQMNFKEILTPEDHQRILQQTVIRKTGKSSEYDLNIIHKDGSQVIISVTATPVIDNNGEYKGAFGLFHDITERKQAEEELEKHRNQLEELVKERTKELEEANKELKRFNKLFVGREFRIKELKDKIKELEKETGRKKQ